MYIIQICLAKPIRVVRLSNFFILNPHFSFFYRIKPQF